MRHYRLAYREVSNATNERTGIFCLLPPPNPSLRNAASETSPHARPTWKVLLLLGVGNSFVFDFLLRKRVGGHVTRFLLDATPLPNLGNLRQAFLAHAALRLTCNHAGYAALWREQVGDAWREPTPPFTWPVLAGDDARWAVRAAIDAVVAEAYGLTREQYAHVLSSFSHRSYPAAPARCLAAFDELTALGLEAFTREHDPYADLPLNESLPQPVIDLPGQGDAPAATAPAAPAAPSPAPAARPRPARPAPAAAQYALFGGDAGGGAAFVAAEPEAPFAPTPDAATGAPAVAGGADVYETLAAVLAERGTLTSTDAQAATGLDATGVRPHLQRLVADGLARTEGQRRGMRYARVAEQKE